MTRSLRLKLATLLSLAMVAGTGIAADAPTAVALPQTSASQTSIEQIDDLDEIWVRGRKLSAIIEKAEDKFFALYNKLNKNNQFDVYCGQMALAPGSMIMVRACTPAFAAHNYQGVTAYGSHCSGYISNSLYAVTNSNSDQYYYEPSCAEYATALSAYVSTEHVVLDKRPAYAKNVLSVVRSDPRLLEMVRNLGGLYEEMETAQRRYVKVRGVVAERPKPSRGPRTPL